MALSTFVALAATMQLIEKEDYHKVAEALEKVTINKLFARSVTEGQVSGLVYVDNRNDPRTFYVIHPYGMSLLFGAWDNEKFNASFRDYCLNTAQTRNGHEWMQAFPRDWDIVLSDLFKGSLMKSSENVDHRENLVELNTRVNFKFNLDKYSEFKQNYLKRDLSMGRTTSKVFKEMRGSVVPSKFWESAEDFEESGVGFSLFHDEKLASTSFAAYKHDDQLELGIETMEEYRGKGFALYTCAALIDYCLENSYEPVWSCRLENVGSYKLAMKLGFEPTLTLPYYRLSL